MHDLYKMRNTVMSSSFNRIAKQYDTWRLSYPSELFEDIFSFCGDIKTALEIGTGTGKATKKFLDQGIEVTAIEPAIEMLNIACKKYRSFQNFHPLRMSFEEFLAENNGKFFDLVFAASSFQWIKSDDRLNMISSLIKPNGFFVRFKTTTILQSNSVTEKILCGLYEKFFPDFFPKEVAHTSFNKFTYNAAGFEQFVKKNFFRRITFKRDDYIAFANTYTEYLCLPQKVRDDFEDAIRNSISAQDSFNLTQKCSLIMAQKTISDTNQESLWQPR